MLIYLLVPVIYLFVMIKILQTNLGRSRAAHDIAWAAAEQNACDIVVIAEPNKKMCQSKNWLTDKRSDVAVVFLNGAVEAGEIRREEGYVRVRINGVYVYAVYISPNIAIEDFKEKTNEIFRDLKRHRKQAVLIGDVNAKSHLWGSPIEDARGGHVEDWTAQLSWMAMNTGQPTFIRGNSRSHIDVTLCSDTLSQKIRRWEIKNENPFTYHGHIYFEMKGDKDKRNCQPRVVEIKQEVLTETLKTAQGNFYEKLMNAYKQASKIRQKLRTVPYWWNPDIEESRKKCVKIRRTLQRSIGREAENDNLIENLREQLRQQRRNLKRSIRRAKSAQWRSILTELDEDIWGQGYKIVTSNLRGNTTRYKIPEEEVENILTTLFPSTGLKLVRTIVENPPKEDFTPMELKNAIGSLKNKKAPGTDGITNEILKLAYAQIPEEMLSFYNELLRNCEFPNMWKTARVVLIPKPGKDLCQPSAYRPICLLSAVGKVYEKLLVERLNQELDEGKILSRRQHGFRARKSTTTAIMELKGKINESTKKWYILVTIDVKNAFNSIPWRNITKAMKEKGVSRYLIKVMENYFRDRFIVMGRLRHRCTMGVIQGSIVGPPLWNLSYNGVLELPHEPGVETLAYADDLLVMVEGETEKEVKGKAENAFEKIEGWMRTNGLEVAVQKTEMLVVKGPRKREKMKIVLCGEEITESGSMEYLGVTLLKNLNFSGHIKNQIEKAKTRVENIRKILPNVGGPSYFGRRALCSVMHGTIFYAAPVWRQILQQDKYKNALISLQRKTLLRVCSAYRTVSADAVQAISGFPPIDIMIGEVCFLYTIGGRLAGNRRMARRRSIDKWQKRWSQGWQTAAWTRRLIPSIEAWVNCRHRRADYYFTQFLTGHGSFGTFTYRIGKTRDSLCAVCQEQDDPEHVFYTCERWKMERIRLVQRIGDLPEIEGIIPRMVESKEVWSAVYSYVVEVMERKEKQDRESEQGSGT